MGSDPRIDFYTYSLATIFAHATMAQFVNYKFDDDPVIYAAITQFMVCNSPSNPNPKLNPTLRISRDYLLRLNYFRMI